MERLERRAIGRVAFPSRGVLVVCDTQEVLHVGVRDLGPIGVGIRAEADTPNLVGKDVIMAEDVVGEDAKAKADEIEDASGDYPTLSARLDAMQARLERAAYIKYEEE